MNKHTPESVLQAEADEAPATPLYASRIRVYPKSVRGIARRIKWAVLIACLAVYYLLPWLRWARGPGRPDQAILLSLETERFYFFNLELWPQQIYFLAGALILGAFALFLVTSVLGRVWCGYSCPQTVWTDLFMWVERVTEGDRNARMKRDNGPLTFDRLWRKSVKHALWLAVAFWTGGAWIMYYVDAPTVTYRFWHGTASLSVYGFTALFTATTYVLAGWAREQVCTYMCPWPRFQSAMLDEQSLIVTYEGWRGEPRGHRRPNDERNFGDCVDCLACVHACPTGIDIRDGVQLECINCGLCIDACNEIMTRLHRPGWLITWDTLARQKARAAGRQEKLRLLRPRTMIYLAVLAAGMAVMVTALVERAHLVVTAEHDRLPIFVMLENGSIRNNYTLRIVNELPHPARFRVSIAGLPGAQLALADSPRKRGSELMIPIGMDELKSVPILVFAPPGITGRHVITFHIKNVGNDEEIVHQSYFAGPPAGGT